MGGGVESKAPQQKREIGDTAPIGRVGKRDKLKTGRGGGNVIESWLCGSSSQPPAQ